MTIIRRALLVLLVFTLLSPIGGGAQASPPPPALGGSQAQVTPDPAGLTLTWTLPRPTLKQTAAGQEVNLAGWETSLAAPDLSLPGDSLLVALPPEAQPTVNLIAAQREALTWDLPRANAPDAAAPLRLEELGVMRGVRLARLTLQPVALGPQGWQTIRQAKVRLDFGAAVVPSGPDDDALRASVRAGVINPTQVMVAAAAPVPAAPDVSGQWLIEVDQAGLTSVTTAELAAAGFPITTTALTNLQLTRAGVNIPYAVTGDRLRFYAAPRFNRYTASDFYYLAPGSAPALTWAARTGDPSGLPSGGGRMPFLFEQNVIYYPNNHPGPEIPAGRDGDRWMWGSLLHTLGGPTAVLTNTFTLPPLANASGSELTLWLVGYTAQTANPDHRLAVMVNNQPVDEITWDGKTAITATLALQPGVLQTGANLLELTLPGSPGAAVDGVWLDAFQVTTTPVAADGGRAVILAEANQATYPRQMPAGQAVTVLDVTQPDAPVLVSGFSLTAAGALVIGHHVAEPGIYAVTTTAAERAARRIRAAVPLSALLPGQQIDQFILAHPDFIPALAPLLALRASEGLTSHVENVQAIYDAFDGGRPTPEALQAYLRGAYARVYTPSYALLVGDGTFDPRGYLPSSLATYLPPFLANVDPWAGETASDNQFALVQGADHLPDLMLGRLPVNSLAETQTVVGKQVAYAAAAPGQTWTGDWLFVADNPDNDGNYSDHLQTLISRYAPGAFRARARFFRPNLTTPEEFRQNLQAEWSQGAGFVIYNGHSSVDQWAVEVLLHSDQIPNLTNADRLPFVLQMTCFTSSFHIANRATLDEALMRSPLGGALGVWGSTGLGITEGQFYLAEGFLRQVRRNVQPSLGGGMMAGYVHLLSSLDSNEDLIDTYLLLGDPAARLQITYQPVTLLPLVLK